MIRGHGGNVAALARSLGCRPAQIMDVSSNINPSGPPADLMTHLRQGLDGVQRLPEVDSASATTAMAKMLNIDPAQLVAGNGTTQFIYALVPALGAKKVLIVAPTYADYADGCRVHGVAPDHFVLSPENGFTPDLARLEAAAADYDLVVVCNPNNPTGQLIPGPALQRLCEKQRRTRFLIDESYLPFVADAQTHSLVAAGLSNVIVLHSLSKIYRLPGLRIGFLISVPEIAARFRALSPPWCVNSLAQAAIAYITANATEMAAFIDRSRAFVEAQKDRVLETLATCSALYAYPSCTSFILIALQPPATAEAVAFKMARQRILIRDCSNFHSLSPQFIRISMQDSATNEHVAQLLTQTVQQTVAA